MDFEILSYTMFLEENGDLSNIFEYEAQFEQAYNSTGEYTTPSDELFYIYIYGDTTIEKGVETTSSYNYRSLKANDTTDLLYTAETFTVRRIDVNTGLLLQKNKTTLLFDRNEGNRTIQEILTLQEEVNRQLKFKLDINRFQMFMVVGFVGFTVFIIAHIRRKYSKP